MTDLKPAASHELPQLHHAIALGNMQRLWGFLGLGFFLLCIIKSHKAAYVAAIVSAGEFFGQGGSLVSLQCGCILG